MQVTATLRTLNQASLEHIEYLQYTISSLNIISQSEISSLIISDGQISQLAVPKKERIVNIWPTLERAPAALPLSPPLRRLLGATPTVRLPLGCAAGRFIP